MDGLEQIIFDIISNAGEARSILMGVIQDSEKGVFTDYEQHLKDADERIKDAEKAHFKIISSEAKQKVVPFNVLLVHAEDQMMAAEIIRDLACSIVKANRRIAELEHPETK